MLGEEGSTLGEKGEAVACDANGVEYCIGYSDSGARDSVAYSDSAYSSLDIDIDKEAYLKECARTGRVVRVLDGDEELYMRSYRPEEVRENCRKMSDVGAKSDLFLLGDWLMKAQYYLDLAQEANVLAEEVSKEELREIRRRLRDLMSPEKST